MDIINIMLWYVICVCVIICVLCLCTYRAGLEYDQWKEEIDAKGIETALEPVLYNNEVVGYTVVRQWRDAP